MADARIFTCTPTQFQSLATALAAHGLAIDTTKPSGEVVDGKWDIAFAYNGSSALSITVKNHPFAEENMFWDKVQDSLK